MFASVSSYPTVSIIINTLGRADSLDRTLLSLRQLRYPCFEVIVVNGPSEDHTEEILARHADNISTTRCPVANLAVSRNIGISMARGEIVAFIDDDAIPEPDWLDCLVTGYNDSEVSAVGGFIWDQTGFSFQCRVVLADRFGDTTDNERLVGPLTTTRFLSLTGTNSSFRRSSLLEIGGFDEEYAYFLDETDVNLRLIEIGGRAAVVESAEIHHKFLASHLRSETRVPKTMYFQARSKAYFCAVNAGAIYPRKMIVAHLTEYVRAEYRRKKQLFFSGRTSWITSERLMAEVEKGVCDGLRDAFGQKTRKLLTPDLLTRYGARNFKPYSLPLPAAARLRVCLMSQDYPPDGVGGIAQWTREVATGLAQRGHEVTVIARSRQAHPYIDFSEGVWVHRILPTQPPVDFFAANSSLPRELVSYSWSIAQEVTRIQPRRVFDVLSGPIWDLEPLVSLQLLNIPTVISLHTTFGLALPFKPDWLKNPRYLARFVRPVIECERQLLETAPFILTNSRVLLEDLERLYSLTLGCERISLIPHGLSDLAESIINPTKGDPECRLLFVGRLETRKGADLFLSILPGLIDRFPDVQIDIVGDDQIKIGETTLRAQFELQHRMNRDLRSRVQFHGIVPREKLLAFYAGCDIFVAPSRYESFGLIFVEAMMFAKPAVGIAIGGVCEVITSGIEGILIDTDDPVLLTHALSSLIEDPDLRLRMGAAARASFQEKFHASHMIDALERYYRAVSGKDISL